MQARRTAHLLVETRKTGPAYVVKWFESDGRGSAQKKRTIGPAWIERGEDPSGRRSTRHSGWIRRKGRVPEGSYSESAALAEVPRILAAYDADAEKREEDPRSRVLFETAAAAWLEHRVTVGGIKRTTLNDYRSMLRDPDDAVAARGRAPVGRMHAVWGGRELASITTAEVGAWLRKLDRDPALASRSVNKYRVVLSAVFNYAMRPDTYALEENPVIATEKRREAEPAEIITYTVEEVQRIAEAARQGAHRAKHAPAVTEEEREARALEDEQDAALIVVGAYCGLRMGELLALRWRHVGWEAQRLHVQRSYTLGEESSPKGRKGRTVPLADQPAQALARLSQRSRFIKAGDLVFCSRVGGHVDGSALRRRYKAARDAVIADDPDVPVLRFHDLRHTFGTLAASSFDLTNVQAMMGHADARTTTRYLHARPAAEDAAKLTRIFAGGSAAALAPEGDEAPR